MYVIRVLCVLAASLCATAASSAPVLFDLTLRFDGRSYGDVEIRNPGNDVLFSGNWLDEAGDQWGLPRMFDFTSGDTVSFKAEVELGDSPESNVLVSCTLGNVDCGGANLVEVYNDSFDFDLSYGDASPPDGVAAWLYGLTTPGEAVTFDLFAFAYFSDWTQSGDWASWRIQRANFTVLENNIPAPAPIPLPVPALLLPAGLGCLALLRRRRGA